MKYQLAIAAIGLVVAGCAEGPSVYGFYYQSLYTPALVSDAAGQGNTLAVIRNNPFPGDSGNAGILAAMQGQNPGPPLHYTQTPPAGRGSDYEVVVAFGLPPAGINNLCRDNSGAGFHPAPSGRFAATAAFCYGPNLLTEASAIGASAERPEDPRFKRFMNELLVALMPVQPYQDCSGTDC